jgi:hypothetical protein
MKLISALSVWQPWAWLIVNGHKDIENRDWAPVEARIGKRFAIHAPKRRVTKAEYEAFLKIVRKKKIKGYPRSIDEFEYGYIVGTAILDSVSRSSKSFWAQPKFYHWKLLSAKKVSPKKIKGLQSWFTVRI